MTQKNRAEDHRTEDLIDDVLKDAGSEKQSQNPAHAEMEKSRPSLQNSGHAEPVGGGH